MIVCVAGSPSIDRLFLAEQVLIGEIHRPQQLFTVAGGKGLNVARAALAIGAEVHATGMVAGHAGQWVADALATEGVPASLIWTAGETRTSLSVATSSDPGVLTEFYEDAPQVTDAEWSKLCDLTAGLLGQAGWMTLSGALAPGAPIDGYAHLISIAADGAIPVALDASGEALLRGVAVSPAIVKVNVSEAAEVVSVDPSLPIVQRALEAALALRSLSGGAVVVTCGEDGLVGLDSDGTAWRGSLGVRGPYPVGSGDACLAGLITALDDGGDWPEALALALGVAAANAEQPGAGSVDGARARDLGRDADVAVMWRP